MGYEFPGDVPVLEKNCWWGFFEVSIKNLTLSSNKVVVQECEGNGIMVKGNGIMAYLT